MRFRIQSGFGDLLARAGLASAEALLAAPGERVAASRSTEVTRVALREGPALYVKRHRFPTPRDRVRGAFRGTLLGRSKARREFENLERLRAAGFDVAEPVAFGEIRGALFLSTCFVVTREIENVRPADRFWAESTPAERREAVEAAARLAASLHGAGYTDGSLAARNILLGRTEEGLRACKVDCAKGRWRIPPGRRAMLDLARLDAGAKTFATQRERLRFLRVYLGGRLGRRGRRWIETLARARSAFEIWEVPRLGSP